MSKTILLTRGFFSVVDDDKYDLLCNYKWQVRHAGSKGQYFYAFCRKENLLLHRLIMSADINHIVDHINGDTLDNRKENLRLANKQTNRFNCKPRSKRKIEYKDAVPYKGVWWDKRTNKWRAIITINGRKICNGYWSNVKDAAIAFNELAIKHHGEFACLNRVEA